MPLEQPVQAGAGQVRDGCLQRIEAIVERQQRVLACDNTVERGAFGPIDASWTKSRFFHFITVFGFRW
jgi:hypothetical protein